MVGQAETDHPGPCRPHSGFHGGSWRSDSREIGTSRLFRRRFWLLAEQGLERRKDGSGGPGRRLRSGSVPSASDRMKAWVLPARQIRGAG